jgi:hypothetical protein
MSVNGRVDICIEEVSDMRIDRRWFVAMAILFLPLLVAGKAYGETRYRWDIINRSVVGTTATVSAGGVSSAKANDGSMITVTGSGTFTVGDDDVTGGGTWTTFEADGTTVTGTGTYKVTRLVRFDGAQGSQTPGVIDTIGDGTLSDNRAGLAILRIDYSDGSKGILEVGCHLPGNNPPAPESIFEGITASKVYTGYWNRLPPTGVNGNRTLFHILPED